MITYLPWISESTSWMISGLPMSLRKSVISLMKLARDSASLRVSTRLSANSSLLALMTRYTLDEPPRPRTPARWYALPLTCRSVMRISS